MPVMDGWKLLHLMSNYVGLSSIPVIIVTAHQPLREQLRHPAIFACLQSPYAIEELIDAVDTCLSAARKPAAPLAGSRGEGGP